jgi:predicted regulator of Ras-like GTPase activity (Roadblock/LC7/MglB family)
MSYSEHPLTRHARSVADALLVDIDGASAIVVATADGFHLAQAGARAVDPARLAAIVSSLAALGDAASRETGIGTARSLVVDCSDGRLVVRCIQVRGESIIVVMLTGQGVLLGLALNSLAKAEQLMNAA